MIENTTATAKVPVLEAKELTLEFPGRFGSTEPVRALNKVNVAIHQGEIVALVGESGSGKSTLARVFSRIYQPTEGEFLFRGESVPNKGKIPKSYYADVQMIFQDPFNSLNSLKRISHILARPLQIHGIAKSRKDIRAQQEDLLTKVNLLPAASFLERFPSDLSGGQRQRVAIAKSLAVRPRVLIADEPTSMLDASIRLEILNLLMRMRKDESVGLLYITHDIASARYISDRIVVMYKGEVVEEGPTDRIIGSPQHEYTKQLISAAPNPAHYKGSDREKESTFASPTHH
ncbi:ABC transporter ATP-binding protein [Haematomicrobium sanguinis]|uniref:ABC transporter ATP-binding protein n=1 Tax=Haematomicrobium sanguinis TaxID=479106 RepID=UPI00068B9CBA|nr:ATP-binding cassette domain-containing protein [Haematomicrobium sanguinis]